MKYATRTQAALYPVKVGGRKLVTAEFANELECESDQLTKQCVSLVEEIGTMRVELARAKKLQSDFIAYIESAEVQFDGESGCCRKLHELIEDDEMPEIYNQLKAEKS